MAKRKGEPRGITPYDQNRSRDLKLAKKHLVRYKDGKEILKKTKKYIKECNDEYEQYITYKSEKGDRYAQRLNVRLPSYTGLALFLGVHEDTILMWNKKHSEFSELCSIINLEQKKRLMDKGLAKQYDPQIVKLLLSSIHGMHEKTEQAHEFTLVELINKQEAIQSASWDDTRKQLEQSDTKSNEENYLDV